MDYWIRATVASGRVRALATCTTLSARSAQAAHRAAPLAAAAMGRVIGAAVLVAADLKEGGTVRLSADGGGPVGRVVAEAWGESVRARVDNPTLELDLRQDGKLNVGQAVGRDGELVVTQETDALQVWQSRTSLVTGEIGEDLAQFYAESAQVPAAVALGVLIGRDGQVAASGGLVVQALPGGGEEAVAVARKFERLSGISHRMAAGESPEEILASVVPVPLRWHGRHYFGFRCRCSRERSATIVQGLPDQDMDQLIEQQGAEVICNFCRHAYRFSGDQLLTWHRAR